MKAKPYPSILRSVAFALALLVTAESVVRSYALAAFVVQAATNAPAKPTGQTNDVPVLSVNRRPSVDAKPALLPQFSSKPTDSEMFAAHVFDQPLVPIGTTTVADNQALKEMLAAYVQRTNVADQSVLLSFLSQQTNSAWKPVLLFNLGINWRKQGRFSKAIDAWREAWELSQSALDLRGKSLADEILGQRIQLYTWVGAYDELEPLLAEVKDRSLMGGVTETVSKARNAVWNSQHRPGEGSKCGPYALQQLLSVTQTNKDISKVFEARVSKHGFSLSDLKQFALESGMKYQMAKWISGNDIPLNSVVHFKLNHYAALLRKENNQYLLRDTAYNRIFGQALWVNAETLANESDGYFLIPAGPLPIGWQSVSDTDGKKVLGSGPTDAPDPNAFGPKDAKSCPNNQSGGSHNMAQASAHLMLVSLNIVDTPLYYQPPVGLGVEFQITYNQKEPPASSKVVPNYSNMGPKWTFDWISYISDVAGANADRSQITRYGQGGGITTHILVDAATGQYAKDRDNGVLQYNSGNDSYVLTFPDGSMQTFGHADTGVSGASRRVYLTELKDPAGNRLTLEYDNLGRLWHIFDALNQMTTLQYELGSDVYKITKVVAPLNRTASFEYDQHGRLSKSIDMINMVSAFNYDKDDFINQLVTPYGISTFSFTDANGVRSLLMTDPNGDREYLIFGDNLGAPANAPEGVPSDGVAATVTAGNGLLNYRNTYYYNKKAMSEALSQYGPGVLPPNTDWANATIYHWLHDNEGYDGANLTSGILECIKPPLESHIWYYYPGQIQPYYSAGISSRSPSIITRLVQDPNNPGSSLTQTYQYSCNDYGKITQFIDPRGRKTDFDYYGNGLDLQRVRQTTSNGSDVLAEYGGYNSAHRPSYYKDAARQGYDLEWNSFGQLTRVSTPYLGMLSLNYDANGYLLTVSKSGMNYSGGSFSIDNTLTYDDHGRVRTVTYFSNYAVGSPDGRSHNYTLTYDYDKIDRVTKITYPDSTTEKFVYNRLDLAIAYDRAGNRTDYNHDAVGRLTSVKDRLDQVIRFAWCGCGSLDSITDPLNHTTSWSRDLEGRVLQKTFEDGKSENYAYDAFGGQLQSVTDAKNQIKNYFYNKDNTLAKVTYTGATYTGANGASISTPPVSFTYDPYYQRLATMTDGNGQTTYTYNPITGTASPGAGRLGSELNNFTADTIAYTYDNLGRLTGRAIDSASESVSIDGLGRVYQHQSVLGLSHADFGSSGGSLVPVFFQYPNGQQTYYTFNDNIGDNRLSILANATTQNQVYNGFSLYSNFRYNYDHLGRITQSTESKWHSVSLDSQTAKTYEYDAQGQLLSANLTDQNGHSDRNKDYAYAYDVAGNRTSQQVQDGPPQNQTFPVPGGGTITALTTPVKASLSGFNSVNQMSTRSGSGTVPVRFKGSVNEPALVWVNSLPAVRTADPASATGGQLFSLWVNLVQGAQNVQLQAKDFGAGGGNVTTKTANIYLAGGFGADKIYSYDNNGNCIGYTSAAGNVTYEWDAENRLVAINSGVHRSEFTYDGFSRRVQIVEKNNNVVASTRRYVWCGQKMCEERDGNNLVTKRFFAEGEQIGGNNYYYTFNHLGSIQEMTDAGGNVRAQYDYDAYGNQTKLNGDLDADLGYAGYYKHAPSGLYLTLFRAYDADSGRWLNRDPIQELGGLNLYAYVGNNPINKIDPYGLWTVGVVINAEIDFLFHVGIHGGFHVGKDPDSKKWSFGFVGGPELGSGGLASADATINIQCTKAPKVKDLKGLGAFIGGGGGEGPVVGGDVTAGIDVDDFSKPVIPGAMVGVGVGGGIPVAGHVGFSWDSGWDSDTGWGWK